ncbi:MAG: hypothetical protein N2235_26080 [Fischerella sp.]|nr:hypothetical protein [Fischerella sp.]
MKDDLLVKIFGGYVASQDTILEELERHRRAHLERLSTYKALERQYFQDFQKLSEPAKFHYLTLLKGIGYETHWLDWCERAIKLLKSTV